MLAAGRNQFSTCHQVIPMWDVGCAANYHCTSERCHYFIQQQYDDLVSCLKRADEALPRHKPGTKKDWWSDDLSDLKQQSMDIHRLWIAEGRPSSGPTHLERLRVRAAYKRAVRQAQRAPKQAQWNSLHTAMQDDDQNSFWNSWRSIYNKNKSSFVPVVDGCSGKEAIAKAFRKSFQAYSEPNNRNKVEELNSRFSSRYSQVPITEI